jgi:hypothetical protein
VNKANGLRLGDPMNANTHMGPLISAKQLDILEEQVSATTLIFSFFLLPDTALLLPNTSQ